MLPYDPSTQVPLIVRGPGIPRGRVCTSWSATSTSRRRSCRSPSARAGLPQDGRSLLPFARDPQRRTQRAFLHETGGERYVPVRDQDQDGEPAVRRILSYRAVRTNRWLYVEYRSGERELYDLERDPNELHSHAYEPRYAATRHTLHRVLRRLAHCRGASCRRPAPAAAEAAPPASGRRSRAARRRAARGRSPRRRGRGPRACAARRRGWPRRRPRSSAWPSRGSRSRPASASGRPGRPRRRSSIANAALGAQLARHGGRAARRARQAGVPCIASISASV